MSIDATAPRDFDFMFGTWTVRHRRLRERLVGCLDWEEFSGTSETRPILGGFGNLEDNLLTFPGGSYRASALRSYDADSRTWAIWWLAATDPHRLDVPVIGTFEGDIGRFFSDETINGEPVKVRFMWTRTDPDAPRWEQAMSTDEGHTWETNWTMDFTRA